MVSYAKRVGAFTKLHCVLEETSVTFHLLTQTTTLQTAGVNFWEDDVLM